MVARNAAGAPGALAPTLESLLADGLAIGPALRALRIAKGLSLQEISALTYVRRAYLEALEDMALARLPSGPFAAGYARAYAQAMGANGDLAAARMRQAAPRADEPLKAPAGVPKARDPRLSWLAGACAVVVTTVGVWNLSQHAVAHDGGPTPPAPVANTPSPAPLGAQGPVALGAPQPAPADSDVPTPYVTPGMAKAVGEAEPAPAAPAKVFPNPRAAVYGAPPDRSAFTLRALKPATLVVKGADGSIYFARQLSVGESFRGPANVHGLTVDVSDPQAFEVLWDGQDLGALKTAQTAVDKLAPSGKPGGAGKLAG
jgi:hypothetical protein